MTLSDTERLSELMKHVSEVIRLRMLLLLSEQERNVATLRADLGISTQALVSHHLGILRLGHLVERNRRGTSVFYRLTDKGRRLIAALDTLAA